MLFFDGSFFIALRETKYGLEEIAELMEYQFAAYFCRMFQRETGQTPTEFRKEFFILRTKRL